MDRPEPDLTGFRDAQGVLIAKLGTDVEFFMPVEEQWPPGTVLDPETNQPYDPETQPLSSGFSSASVRCGVVRGRVGTGDDELTTAIGEVQEGEAVLLIPIEDYEGSGLDAATEAEINDKRYEITQRANDGLGGESHRKLVWCRQL